MKTYWVAYEIEVPDGLDPTKIVEGTQHIYVRTDDPLKNYQGWVVNVVRVRALWPGPDIIGGAPLRPSGWFLRQGPDVTAEQVAARLHADAEVLRPQGQTLYDKMKANPGVGERNVGAEVYGHLHDRPRGGSAGSV